MKYDELTDEQKQAIADAEVLIRPMAGNFAKLANLMRLTNKGSGAVYIRNLLSMLDKDQLIPKSKQVSLAGAVFLSQERFNALLDLSTAIDTLLTEEALTACVDAAGPTNSGG